jgi:hypothetical protein
MFLSEWSFKNISVKAKLASVDGDGMVTMVANARMKENKTFKIIKERILPFYYSILTRKTLYR